MTMLNPLFNRKSSLKKNRLSLPKIILLLLATFIGFRLIYWHLFLPGRVRASDLTIDNILKAVNRERELRNLVLLNTDSRLSAAAQSKSDDMQARHYFNHVDPDGNYIWPKIVAAGYTPYLQLGENLAIEFFSTESLVNAWMNSPTHRANVLNEGFRDQGMGLAFGNSDQGQYHSAITNTFGTLALKKTAPAPSVKSENTQTATTPAPAPSQSTPPKTTSPAPQTPRQTQIPTPSPTQETRNPIALRGDENQGYALPQTNQATSSSTTEANTAKTSPVTVSSQALPVSKNPMDLTRYLSLAFTALVIIFIVSDIKDAFRNKLAGLDKKINNLVLLILAILVLVFLYWF